jgi:hypothetical protein
MLSSSRGPVSLARRLYPGAYMHRVLLATMICFSLFSACASAQTREEILVDLVRAQGLQEMFDQTLQQTKVVAEQSGRKAFSQMLAAASNIDTGKKQRLEGALERYLGRVGSMWKADELVTLWTLSYGKELSDQDLKQILAYYRSPTGIKDVSATKAAVRMFTASMSSEMQRRLHLAVEQLMLELKAEINQ